MKDIKNATKKEMYALVDKYFDLKDELEDYTSKYHDEIFYDCQGYYEDLSESEDDETFNAQVLVKRIEAVKALHNALKGYTASEIVYA